MDHGRGRPMKLWLIAATVLALNLPFGFWRARVRKFSWQWILAIHLPVPLVIALRISSGLGWRFYTFPVMIGAFFLGQMLGARIGANFTRGAGTSSDPGSPPASPAEG